MKLKYGILGILFIFFLSIVNPTAFGQINSSNIQSEAQTTLTLSEPERNQDNPTAPDQEVKEEDAEQPDPAQIPDQATEPEPTSDLEQNEDKEIHFSYTNSGLSFGAISINDNYAVGSLSLTIQKQGLFQGDLQINITDFTSELIPDPTSDGSLRATFTKSLCELEDIKILLDGVETSLPYVGRTDQTGFSVKLPTNADGEFQVLATYKLSIPRLANILELTNQESRYKPGLEIGLPAAAYNSNVVITDLTNIETKETDPTPVSESVEQE